MAAISVSEKTFTIIANAAVTCYTNNEIEEAEELDKIARRINAALSNESLPHTWGRSKGQGLKWQDVPSVLEHVRGH